MEQQPKSIDSLPFETKEGDIISHEFEITCVSNGFIIKSTNENDRNISSTMVFNNDNSHREVAGYMLRLVLSDMKDGEVIKFNAKVEFIKK